MSPAAPLPTLSVSDFGPGKDHVAEAHQNGRVFAILHVNDPARALLPHLHLAADDPWTYVFVHGGKEVTRFENMEPPTHEIPDDVVASLLRQHYAGQLSALRIGMCSCYGNLVRPGERRTLVGRLASLLPSTVFEGYHGLVRVVTNPPAVLLGLSVQWDAFAVPPGPVIVGPPGTWEPIPP
jgi:hypothetical protein